MLREQRRLGKKRNNDGYKVNKNIITLRTDDFIWPKHLNRKFPEEKCSIENAQSILLSREYFDAIIDTIVKYMFEIDKNNRQRIKYKIVCAD